MSASFLLRYIRLFLAALLLGLKMFSPYFLGNELIMAIVFSGTGIVRGLEPFSGSLILMVKALESISIHLSRKISPSLSPVVAATCKNVAVRLPAA